MSVRATGIREDLYDYLLDNFSGEDDFLKKLKEETAVLNFPQISISPEQVKFLQFIIKSIKAKNLLEIGTLGGYSAIAMARAIPEDGKLLTIELEPKHAEYASNKIESAGLSHKIKVVCQDGLKFLRTYKPQEQLDFIFLDADKNHYYKYVNMLEPYLKVGGIIAADNAFAFGFVVQSAPERNPEDVKSIKSFNNYMNNHPNFFTTLAPVGDGMLMSLKIQNSI